jgi:hypothetical protein
MGMQDESSDVLPVELVAVAEMNPPWIDGLGLIRVIGKLVLPFASVTTFCWPSDIGIAPISCGSLPGHLLKKKNSIRNSVFGVLLSERNIVT